MELSIKIIRWVIIVWNVLQALGAVLFLVMGVLLSVVDAPYDYLPVVAMVYLLNGVCYLVFAVFGFWGALRKQHCMLYTHAVMALCLLLAELAWEVYLRHNWPQMKAAAQQNMEHIYNNYTSDSSAKRRVDSFQRLLDCCGSTSPSEPWTALGVSPPASCYSDVEDFDTELVDYTPEDQKPHAEACIPQSLWVMEDLFEVDPVETFLGLAVLVVTVVLSLLLLRSLRRDQLSRMSDGGEMHRL